MPPPSRLIDRLPSAEDDPRAGQTALVVAIGGAICPVPFLMSAVAVRIATSTPAPRRTRAARIALRLAAITIVLQVAGIVVLVALVL